MYSYQATNADEMSFEEGQSITVVDRSETDWWKTEQHGQILLVPAGYLEVVSGKFSNSSLRIPP